MHYWFRPKRFWKYFAAYYPSSKEGWVLTLIILAVAFAALYSIVQTKNSINARVIAFVPWALALLIVWDVACRRTGEYPSWWRKWKK